MAALELKPLKPEQVCACGVYMHIPRRLPEGGRPVCAACYCKATRVVAATTRLNLRNSGAAAAASSSEAET